MVRMQGVGSTASQKPAHEFQSDAGVSWRLEVDQGSGDWKWIKDHCGISNHYGTREPCHRCCVDYTDLSDFHNFAEMRSQTDFERTENARKAPLTSLRGFSIHALRPEPLHIGPLGIMQHHAGSCLADLAFEGKFCLVTLGQPWMQMIGEQLSMAYNHFDEWARLERLSHSQARFSCAKIGLTTRSTTWPCLKAKGHNCMIVVRWLSSFCWQDAQGHADDSKEMRRASASWGFDMLYRVGIEARDPNWLTAEELAMFETAGMMALSSTNELSKMALASGHARFKIVPKHHAMMHWIQDTIWSSRNPMASWTMSDESCMNHYGKIAASSFSGGNRVGWAVNRWLIGFMQNKTPSEMHMD